MIHVGTSGFSYDDWRGAFYPPGLPKSRMFDYYAERFEAVEINSTFYHIPGPGMLRSLVERAAGRVVFGVKAPREMTHQGDLSAATVRAFTRAIEPPAAADRLGAVLLQFPYRFHHEAANRAYLLRALESLRPFSCVVEIRHVGWQAPPALDFFRDRAVNLCLLDLPNLRGLPRTSHELTGTIAYVRFHGRNGAKWFTAENSSEPYDYLYDRDQLKAWIEPLRTLERRAQTTFAFFNNHVRGQGPDNAQTLMELLGRPPSRAPAQAELF